MNKSVWIAIISAIVAAAIAVGVVFIVQNANRNGDTDNNNTTYSITYLQSEYDVGDDIVYDFIVFSDVQFKSLTYKLNNGEEQQINGVKVGESAKHDNYSKGAGKYYADSKVQIISTADFSDGYYTLVFFGYDKDNQRYEINKTPYAFKLAAVEVSEAA